MFSALIVGELVAATLRGGFPSFLCGTEGRWGRHDLAWSSFTHTTATPNLPFCHFLFSVSVTARISPFVKGQ